MLTGPLSHTVTSRSSNSLLLKPPFRLIHFEQVHSNVAINEESMAHPRLQNIHMTKHGRLLDLDLFLILQNHFYLKDPVVVGPDIGSN